ncbi:MAG: sugar phosphate isomerase/epimerase family protein [Blastocatellia bacterium]
MDRKLNRREFLNSTAASLAAAAWPGSGLAAAPLCKMGIASTSFMGAEIGAGPSSRPAGPPRARDTLAFLEKCAALGAGGIQASLNGDLARVRARADELGMYLEGMVGIPRNGDMTALDRTLAEAKAAGVKVVRAAMLSGRRYETFSTLADWKRWVEQAHAALKLALPVIEKHKVIVALENHKDWTLEDFLALLKTWSSEYLQVCLDFGNNISLLDDPMELIEGLAPYAQSTHIKDMAVQPYQDGFLLSEVPLGEGLLDLPKIVSVIQKANPKVKFSLEMITRDPLKVPCMTPQYWEVFPDRNGRYLAGIFRLVRDHGSRSPLPTVAQLPPEERARIEEENVKACIRYVNQKQLIA